MRKLYIIGLIGLACIIICLVWAAGELLLVGSSALAQPPIPGPEEITITTYYPAPYGVYRQMETSVSRLVPSSEPPIPFGEEEEGMIYFDDGTNRTKGCYYWDSTASDWVLLGVPGGLQVVGNTDISTPDDGTETLMDGMRIAYRTSWGHSLLVMFSAPIARDPTYSGAQDAYIRIYIDGVVQTEQRVRTAQDKDTRVYQVNLRWIGSLSGGADHTVEIRWQDSGIEQPGATCAERVLTILPIG